MELSAQNTTHHFSRCFTEPFDEREKQLIKEYAADYVARGDITYWKDVRTYTELAVAERQIVNELCQFVIDGCYEEPYTINKVQLAAGGARTSGLIDLVIQAKKCGLDCPQVPYPNVQYILDVVYKAYNCQE